LALKIQKGPKTPIQIKNFNTALIQLKPQPRSNKGRIQNKKRKCRKTLAGKQKIDGAMRFLANKILTTQKIHNFACDVAFSAFLGVFPSFS
jgi:hypothetical protein